MAEDYGKTLNLPNTEFSMRANLPQREPEILKKWEDENMYEKLMENNKDKPLFILHDGPPYANGDMHMGHALNKTLKDVITRFKNMDGFRAPYIHGWDTHGLPIERQAIKKLGVNLYVWKADGAYLTFPKWRDKEKYLSELNFTDFLE